MKVMSYLFPIAALFVLIPCFSEAQHPRPDSGGALLKKAEAGDASAMYELGMQYEAGLQVKQSPVLGVQWLKKAALAGNTRAMDRLGDMYGDGDGGVIQNYGESLKYYGNAANLGSAQGMQDLGDCYKDGHGVSKDLDKANAWYAKALETAKKDADTNDISSMALARLYESGSGVPLDEAETLRRYRQAAAAGNPSAMDEIGFIYAHGHSVPVDFGEAMRWYRNGADAGNIAAMNNIGYLYMAGQGVVKDYAEAMKWYGKAAGAEHPSSIGNIGFMYMEGLGVTKDYARAMKMFRKALDIFGTGEGHGEIMVNVGNLYLNGLGVPADEGTARKWFHRAADAGNKDAIKWLADNPGS